MAEKNLDLIFEFQKYVLTHPETAARIPHGAVVVMQVEGNKQFNQWSWKVGQRHAKEGHPLVCVTVKKIGPVRSRIERLEIGRSAAKAS
ncbi:MAG: hypothetical protein HY726_09445 [Candidatus Rokubacteria bacterium]|nr:hypothetical protein [Candidatus Rokubacteria bacterium]